MRVLDKYDIRNYIVHGYLDYQTKQLYEESLKAYDQTIAYLSTYETWQPRDSQEANTYNDIYYNFPVPNDLALLYKDLVNGTGESIISLFSDIHRDLKEKHEKSEVMIKGLRRY